MGRDDFLGERIVNVGEVECDDVIHADWYHLRPEVTYLILVCINFYFWARYGGDIRINFKLLIFLLTGLLMFCLVLVVWKRKSWVQFKGQQSRHNIVFRPPSVLSLCLCSRVTVAHYGGNGPRKLLTQFELIQANINFCII